MKKQKSHLGLAQRNSGLHADRRALSGSARTRSMPASINGEESYFRSLSGYVEEQWSYSGSMADCRSYRGYSRR